MQGQKWDRGRGQHLREAASPKRQHLSSDLQELEENYPRGRKQPVQRRAKEELTCLRCCRRVLSRQQQRQQTREGRGWNPGGGEGRVAQQLYALGLCSNVMGSHVKLRGRTWWHFVLKIHPGYGLSHERCWHEIIMPRPWGCLGIRWENLQELAQCPALVCAPKWPLLTITYTNLCAQRLHSGNYSAFGNQLQSYFPAWVLPDGHSPHRIWRAHDWQLVSLIIHVTMGKTGHFSESGHFLELSLPNC